MAINYIWSNATNKNGDTNWRGSTFRIKKDIRITEILVLSDFPTNISNLELWETDNSGKFSLKIHGGVPSARTGEAYLTCETTLLKDKNYTIVFKQSVSAVGNFYSIVSGVSTVSDSFEALSTIGSSNFNYSNPTTAPSVGVSASGNSIEVQVGFKEKEPLNKILILSSDRKVISHENDGVNGIVKYIPNNSEQNFINHGLDKSAQIDLNAPMTNKVLIEQSSTPLGEGKVFKKSIDISQMVIKKVEVK